MSLSISVKEIVEQTTNTMLMVHQNWLRVLIDDICLVLNGYAFKSSCFNNKTFGIPLIRIRDVQESSVETYYSGDYPKEYIITAGDILVGMDGDFNCKKWNNIPALLNQRVCKIQIVSDNYLNDFLYYALPPYLTEINQWTSAVTVKHLSSFSIKEIPLPLPPLNEQKRIVAKLDAIMPRIEVLKVRLDKVPGILKRFRQSVLTAAVTGKLTEQWREEHPEVGEWEEQRAENCCIKVQSGGTPKNGNFSTQGVPFLKVYNIVNQKVNFNYKPQWVSNITHEKELKKSMGIPNDIIMNIVGPPLGKVAILPSDFNKWNINQAITLFRPGPKLNHQYLYWLLCEGTPYAQVLQETRGSAGQSNISLTQCREMVIILPPLEEQKEIVRQVDKLFALADKVEAHYQKAKAKVDKLSQSVLAKAFRGELVPQDPNDEPAEKLLERIQEEKAKMEAALKGVRKKGIQKTVKKKSGSK